MPKLKALRNFLLPSVNLRCKRKIFHVTIADDNCIGSQTNLPLKMSEQDTELALYANLMSPICQYDFKALFALLISPFRHLQYNCTKTRTFIKSWT